MRKLIILAGILAAGTAAYLLVGQSRSVHPTTAETPNKSKELVEVKVPTTLTADAAAGRTSYQVKCATCHGENAAGQDGLAPPLVHKIYKPSHHGNEAFQRAAAVGVRGHHWPFGDMPPVEGLTRADVAMIVTYIRELQRFNGIN